MAQDAIFTKGLFVNAPREGAPEFVLGGIAITKSFLEWANDNPQYFNEKGYLKVDLLKSREGDKAYGAVNTYGLNLDAPAVEAEPLDTGDLPF